MGMLWRGIHKFQHLEVAPGGTFKGYGNIDLNGRVYYVNNITGTSGATGLSWKDPFDEISTAIAASEAFRELGERASSSVSTNDYIRNTIVVQGTATAYTELDDVGNHINFIGLGDNMMGYTVGIARIGADSGSYEFGISTSTHIFGNYFYNLQFQAGGITSASVKCTNISRTTFENCGFFVNGSPVQSPEYGFWIIGTASGLHIKDCHWGNGSSATATCRNGLYIDYTHFHNCVVEGCHITGIDTGIYVVSTCINTHGSVVRNNYIGSGGANACAIGIDDNDTSGYIIYQNNFINADTAMDLQANLTSRNLGNMKGTVYVTVT